MRNPVRFKNLRLRFWPVFALVGVAIGFSQPTGESLLIGLPVVVLGLAIRGWGAGHLVKNEAFVRTGPYAHVRHPLYLGTLCIGVGFALVLGGWVTFAVLGVLGLWFFLLYFPRKERIESDRLMALYGDAYARYRDEVPALRPALRPGRAHDRVAEDGDGIWLASRYDANNELGTLIAVLMGMALMTAWAVLRG